MASGLRGAPLHKSQDMIQELFDEINDYLGVQGKPLDSSTLPPSEAPSTAASPLTATSNDDDDDDFEAYAQEDDKHENSHFDAPQQGDNTSIAHDTMPGDYASVVSKEEDDDGAVPVSQALDDADTASSAMHTVMFVESEVDSLQSPQAIDPAVEHDHQCACYRCKSHINMDAAQLQSWVQPHQERSKRFSLAPPTSQAPPSQQLRRPRSSSSFTSVVNTSKLAQIAGFVKQTLKPSAAATQQTRSRNNSFNLGNMAPSLTETDVPWLQHPSAPPPVQLHTHLSASTSAATILPMSSAMPASLSIQTTGTMATAVDPLLHPRPISSTVVTPTETTPNPLPLPQEPQKRVAMTPNQRQGEPHNHPLRTKVVRALPTQPERVNVYNEAYEHVLAARTDMVPWVKKQYSKGPPPLVQNYTPRPRRSSSKSLFSLFKRQSQPRLGALAAGATPLRGDDAASTYTDAGPTKSHVYQTPNAISPLSSIHSGHSQPPPPHWNKSSSELLINSQPVSQPQWQQQDSIQPHPLQSSQQQQQQHDADLLALDFPLSRSPASGSVLSMESQKELQMRKRHSRSLSLSVVEDDEPLVSPLSPSDSIVSSSSFSSNNAGKDDRLHVNPILRKSSSNTSLRSSQTSSPVSILKKRSSSSSLASGFTSPLSAASSSSRSRPPMAASSSSRMIPHANQHHHHHQPSLEPKKKMNRPVAKSSSYLNLRDQYHQALPVPSMQPRSRSVSPIPMAQMAQMAPMASNYAQNRQRPRKNATAPPPPPLSVAMPPLSRSPSPLLSPMAYDDAPPHPRLGRPRSSSSLSSQYAAGASSNAAWLGISGQKRRQPGTRTLSLYRARSHEQLGWNDMASSPPQPRPRRSWTGKIDMYASHGERAMYQPPPPTQPANRRRSASRLSWYGRTDDHSRTPPAAVYSSQEPALDDLCAFFHHLPRHVLAKYLHNAHGDFYLAKDMCMEDIMIHGI